MRSCNSRCGHLLGVHAAGGVRAALGAGANEVLINASELRGDLLLSTGGGSDDFILSDLHLVEQANAKVSAGDGNNLVELKSSTVTGNLVVKSGVGDDVIDLTDTAVDGTTTISAGGGLNTITP